MALGRSRRATSAAAAGTDLQPGSAVQELTQRSAELAQAACDFPPRLHPVSQMLLDYYLGGQLSAQEFLRFFSLPNSDYIPLARCVVDALGARLAS